MINKLLQVYIFWLYGRLENMCAGDFSNIFSGSRDPLAKQWSVKSKNNGNKLVRFLQSSYSVHFSKYAREHITAYNNNG